MIARLFVIIVAPPIIAYAFAATFITESLLAVKLAWLSAGSEFDSAKRAWKAKSLRSETR